MRIFVDPESVSSKDYVAITTELVKQNKFMVIDRSQGFKAVQNEQERLHRYQSDRFSNKEKYALWGKMYGVGAIVVGHSQCYKRKPLINFSSSPYVNSCHQYLSLIDANTGEVIVAVNGKDEQPTPGSNWGSESFTAPSDWAGVVADFVEAYPKVYKPEHYSEGMVQYRDIAEQEAIAQEELTNTPKGLRTPSSEHDLMYIHEAVRRQNNQIEP